MAANDTPSPTALLAAAARAAHALVDAPPLLLEDPAAHALCTTGDAAPLDFQLAQPGVPVLAAARVSACARARHADDVLVARRAQQVVVLGAGLDTTTHRRPAPGRRFWLVDLPDVLTWRARLLARAGLREAGVPVPADLGDAGWFDTLVDAGLDPHVPVVAVWLPSAARTCRGRGSRRPAGTPRRRRRASAGRGPRRAVTRPPSSAAAGAWCGAWPLDRSLGGIGFALVWAWGVGGVAGSVAVGRPLDRHGPRPLLVGLPALLLAAFALLTLTTSPATWLVAAALWGAAGWASVPTLQQALTRHAPERAMSVVAFQMAAMYLGSAAGAAAGGALLAAGVRAGTLVGWALAPAGLALVLTGTIAARAGAGRRTTAPALARATRT